MSTPEKDLEVLKMEEFALFTTKGKIDPTTRFRL